MATENETVTFRSTKPHTGSFLNVDVAKRVSKSKAEKERFSGNIEFEPDAEDLKGLRATIVAVAQAKWPGKDIGEAIRSGALQVPISDGTVLADKAIEKSKETGKERLREWSRGKKVLTSRSEFQPGLSIVAGGKIVDLDSQDAVVAHMKSHFYTGVQVLFEVAVVAYSPVGVDGKPGVTCYLQKILSTGKGDRLIAGGKSGAETFKDYIGLETQEDPTGGEGAPASATSGW